MLKLVVHKTSPKTPWFYVAMVMGLLLMALVSINIWLLAAGRIDLSTTNGSLFATISKPRMTPEPRMPEVTN